MSFATDLIAHFRLEAGHERLAKHQKCRQVDVIGNRHVILHFKELGALSHVGRILLPVDDALIKGRIHFLEGQRRCVCSQRIEHLNPLAAGRRPDFEAIEIVGGHDRTLVVGDHAETVVPHGDQLHAGAFETGRQHVTGCAIGEFLHTAPILEQIGQVEYGRTLVDLGDRRCRQRSKLDRGRPSRAGRT